ncbi:MAG: hypothetical protein KGH65_05555 [Candidatus Micrarchaeota archaeon]|nr:hypothetical protein [Candidatus Micrarchaeota archaeon]
MPNYSKRKGTIFEYSVQNALKMCSFYVIRAYSSVGICDLVASPPWNPKGNYRSLLIQCKNTEAKDYVKPYERDHLSYLQQINAGNVILVYMDDSNPMVKIWETEEKLHFDQFMLKYYGIYCEYKELLKGFREYRRPIHLYKPEKDENDKFVSSFQDYYTVNVWNPFVPDKEKHIIGKV